VRGGKYYRVLNFKSSAVVPKSNSEIIQGLSANALFLLVLLFFKLMMN